MHVTNSKYLWFITRIATVFVAVVFVGCASVSVRKIPTPTQYTHWTDDMQANADQIQGIRFYLPRPFVSVFESFPVSTDIYWGKGIVSQDGKYVTIDSISDLKGKTVLTNVTVASTAVVPPNPNSIRQEGLTPGFAKSASQPVSLPIPITAAGSTPKSQSPTPLPPDAPTAKTGINQQKSTNNNGAFAYQPLRGNFDLVYMPDFEEQYAVDSFAGLGNANFEVNLGQGWSLQGYNSLTDNSELNKRIFDVIDTSMQLAKTAATAELGQFLPAIQSAAGLLAGSSINQQGLTQMPDPTKGTQVSLKIVVLHYAAKGLYPVIKPRELQERVAKDPVTTDSVLDLFKLFPHTEWASDYDRNSVPRSQQAIELEATHFTIPRYPYQYISFNTFEYITVQLLSPNEQMPQPKYSGTGTDNESGAARISELPDLIKQLQALTGSAPDGAPKSDQGLASDQKAQLSAAITKIIIPDQASASNYSLSTPDLTRLPAVTAQLNITSSGHPQGEDELKAQGEFQDKIIAAAKEMGVVVTSFKFSNRPDLTKLHTFYDDIEKPANLAYPDPAIANYVIADAWLDVATPGTSKAQTGTLSVVLKKQSAPSTPADQDKIIAYIKSTAKPFLDKQFMPSIPISLVVIKNWDAVK